MYDRGGGYFVLDEENQMYFLVRDYSVSAMTPAKFIRDFENVNSLGALWLMVWMRMLLTRALVESRYLRSGLIKNIILMGRARKVVARTMFKNANSGWLILFLIVVVVATAWWWRGGVDRVCASTTSGLVKAQALVAAYAKHVGARDAVHQTLDKDSNRSFGGFAFHYFADKDVLQGRVLIVRSHIRDWPEGAASERQTIAGLNDPKIGGMYDRGGGYFVLDEEKQMYFLMKEYPVSTMTPTEFIRDFENLNSLGALWLMVWMPHVADQSHGKEPLPMQRIDREHNPYGTH